MNNIVKFFVIALLTLTIIIFHQVRYTKVNYISLNTKKIDSTIKILQLTDYHDKYYLNRKNKLINMIKELNPDIIVITGDLIDSDTEKLDNTFLFIEKLLKINPNLYFVSGNHEWRNDNHESLINGLKERNLIILNNTNKVYQKNDLKINLCGIDDPYSNHDDINKAQDNLNFNLYTILLSHSPNIIFKEGTDNIDLILSGHTHGGQIRIPGIGAILAPGQELFPKYDKGLFQVSEKTKIYIDSGLGTSVLPVRLLNRSQMTLITINGI